jgi:hypothetical protein
MKKRILLLVYSFAVSLLSFGQSYPDLIRKADSLYQIAEYRKSLFFFLEAFRIEEKDAGDLYNGACSAALANDTAVAFKLLNSSIQHGWIDIDHMMIDNDLSGLHKHKNWDATVKTLQDTIARIERNYDKVLQKELNEIYDNDQIMRLKFMDSVNKYGFQHPVVDSLSRVMQLNDSINTLKVSKILDEKGWVGKDKVGAKGNLALFLVIQHSDINTQRKYLPLMRDAVKKGNAMSSSLALLEDRVALREGRRQIYGSQIGTNPVTKEDYVLPLEDPDNVDKRRAEVGLEPLSEYVKQWNIIWNVEAYKKRLPELEKWSKGVF